MIYLFFALCIFAFDLFIKKQIEALDYTVFPVRLEGGFVLEKHHNYGFVLNRLDHHPKLVRIVSFMTFVPLLVWSVRLFSKKTGSLGKLGASCLIGGAASNLYDRFFRGYVVDYLRLPALRGIGKKIRNIIFNIADLFLFLGAALTAIYGFFTK